LAYVFVGKIPILATLERKTEMKLKLVSAALALFAVTAVAEAAAPVAPAPIPAVAADGAGSAIQVDYRCPRGAVRTRSGRCVWDRRWRDDRRGWDRHSPRYYRERDRDRAGAMTATVIVIAYISSRASRPAQLSKKRAAISLLFFLQTDSA
jgi:hypothetical protein